MKARNLLLAAWILNSATACPTYETGVRGVVDGYVFDSIETAVWYQTFDSNGEGVNVVLLADEAWSCSALKQELVFAAEEDADVGIVEVLFGNDTEDYAVPAYKAQTYPGGDPTAMGSGPISMLNWHILHGSGVPTCLELDCSYSTDGELEILDYDSETDRFKGEFEYYVDVDKTHFISGTFVADYCDIFGENTQEE